MSRALNSLKTSDVITTPLKLKYTSSYDCSTIAAYGITVLNGINGPVTITGSVSQETINYISVRSSFYSNYLTGSLPQSASAAENYLQSTAAIGSDDADIRYFPTESGALIKALSIPTGVYGQQISKNSFILSSSAYYIVDDANGNIIDTANGRAHVGNIIYGQGIVIITNPDYQDVFPTAPVAVNDTAVFKDVDTPKIIDILANDIPGTCPLDPTSVILSGSNSVYYTVNLNGTITLNTSTPGSYDVYYTVESLCPAPGVCPIISNQALVTATVLGTAWRPIDPYCVQAECQLGGTVIRVPTTTSTTSTTTTVPTTTSTTSTTTTVPTTTSTTTTTTTLAPTTTSTTTSTTTLEPTTTSTTTSTTTLEPTTTTSTTTSTTTLEPTTTSTTTSTTTLEPTTTTSTTTSTTTLGIATFDGDFILCVQAGATLDFRAQDGSATSGHFTMTPYITAGNCSGPVNVTGSLTSAQGPLVISVPAITSPSTNTAVIVSQAIGATNCTITTAVEGGILKIKFTPNSYPTTVTLNGSTLTVTFP